MQGSERLSVKSCRRRRSGTAQSGCLHFGCGQPDLVCVRLCFKRFFQSGVLTEPDVYSMLFSDKRFERQMGGIMEWIEEVKAKIKKKNQVLFGKDSEYLQDLAELLQNQDHRTAALWAFDLAAESIAELKEKYPEEVRPEEALKAVRDWSAGKIKMRLAQRKILDCHAFAKEIDCKEDIALCHAIGQACAVVHTAGHAIGYPIYDLTAVVYRLGIDNCIEAVEKRRQEYIDRLFYWREHLSDYEGEWADFMLK